MAFVVCEPCIRCKYTDCADTCPVDCFYEGASMMVIHPDECIDCAACVPACPVDAIRDEADLRRKQRWYKELNAVYSGAKPASEADTERWPEPAIEGLKDLKPWPRRTETGSPLPDAEQFETLSKKAHLFDPAPAAR